MSDFKTGHIPDETIDAFMRRIRASCHFPESQVTQHPRLTRPKGSTRLQKLLRTIDLLTPQQQKLLRDLYFGKRYLVQVRGAPYACTRTDFGWSLCGLEVGSQEHTVNCDATACSCPDSRMRKRVCKHMETICSFLKR